MFGTRFVGTRKGASEGGCGNTRGYVLPYQTAPIVLSDTLILKDFFMKLDAVFYDTRVLVVSWRHAHTSPPAHD